MFDFREALKQRNPALYSDETGTQAQTAQTSQVLPGLQQIANVVKTVMPTIEEITGLHRRDIFLQLLKTGVRGGNFDSIINGLMGKPPLQDAKFVRYVKTLAVWVPIGFFLLGLSIATLFLYIKFLSAML